MTSRLAWLYRRPDPGLTIEGVKQLASTRTPCHPIKRLVGAALIGAMLVLGVLGTRSMPAIAATTCDLVLVDGPVEAAPGEVFRQDFYINRETCTFIAGDVRQLQGQELAEFLTAKLGASSSAEESSASRSDTLG